MLGAYTLLVDLLHQGHDELGLGYQRIILAVTGNHEHGIQSIPATGMEPNDGCHFFSQGFHQRHIFTFRIANQNIIIGGQNQNHDLQFGDKGLTGTGNTQNERGLVQKLFLVAKDQVVGDGVLAIIQSAPVLDLLHLKGHKRSQRFSGQGAENVDLPGAEGQHRVQTIHLLEGQRCDLAHTVDCKGKNAVGFAVQFFLGVGGDDHRDAGLHHALVASHQILQKFLCFFSLQFHLRGNCGREVVVGVLVTLPVSDVGFNTQQAVLYLPDGFIDGDRQDVDGNHHILIPGNKFVDEVILDKGRQFLQEQHSGIAVSDFQIIAVFFDAVRADIVLEIMAPAHPLFHIKREGIAFLGTVEAMQNTQPLLNIHFRAAGTHSTEAGLKFCADTVKVHPGLVDILLTGSDGNIFLLNEPGAASGLAGYNIVVLLPVCVPVILLHSHEDGFGEIPAVHPVVIDQNLGGAAAVKAIQDAGISQEHPTLVLVGSNFVIDVRKTEGLGILTAAAENAILPDAVDGDQVLNPLRDTVAFLALFQKPVDGFNHGLSSPFS